MNTTRVLNMPFAMIETARRRSIANSLLWGIQTLLAGLFLYSGYLKITQPIASFALSLNWALLGTMNWASHMPPLFPQIIGIIEIFFGIGLLVPAITRIWPRLTIVATAGIMVMMLVAMIADIAFADSTALCISGLLFLLAGFVAYGRWKIVPIVLREKTPS